MPNANLMALARQCTHLGASRHLCCVAVRHLEREDDKFWTVLCESMYRPNGQWRHR